MKKWLAVLVLYCSILQPSVADERVIAALALADDVILPQYHQLQDASNAFRASVNAQCAAGATTDIQALRETYQQLMNRWQQVQWLRTGPSEILFRHHRMQYWPDKHRSGSRQFRKLMLEQKEVKFDPASFEAGSVAIQGLPAAERLLYAKNLSSSDFSENGQPLFRCKYLLALGDNLSSIADGYLRDWNDFYRRDMEKPAGDNPYFESSRTLVSEFLSQAVTQLQFVIEKKLKQPLGLEGDAGKLDYRDAELWRSALSVTAIAINLDSLDSVLRTLVLPLVTAEQLKQKVTTQLEQSQTLAHSLPPSLQTANENDHDQLTELISTLERLHTTIVEQVTADIQIPLGFNSLDGD